MQLKLRIAIAILSSHGICQSKHGCNRMRGTGGSKADGAPRPLDVWVPHRREALESASSSQWPGRRTEILDRGCKDRTNESPS